MLLTASRLVSAILGALNAGLAAAHAVEMRPKRTLSGAEYLTAQLLYRDFGRVWRVTFPGAPLSTLVALALVRDRPAVAGPTAVGAACTAGTIALWAPVNEPVNRRLATWTPETLPDDCQRHRDR